MTISIFSVRIHIKTSLPLIFQDELNVVEEVTSLGSDDNSQCSSGDNVNLKNERKQTNEPYLDNKEDMFCSTTSGDVDKYDYAFSSDIQDDRDDNGDQSNIHLSNIVESIVSTDDDVSLCSLTVCIFGINRIIIPIGIIIFFSNIANIFRNLR